VLISELWCLCYSANDSLWLSFSSFSCCSRESIVLSHRLWSAGVLFFNLLSLWEDEHSSVACLSYWTWLRRVVCYILIFINSCFNFSFGIEFTLAVWELSVQMQLQRRQWRTFFSRSSNFFFNAASWVLALSMEVGLVLSSAMIYSFSLFVSYNPSIYFLNHSIVPSNYSLGFFWAPTSEGRLEIVCFPKSDSIPWLLVCIGAEVSLSSS
jgi:hypothetical protein